MKTILCLLTHHKLLHHMKNFVDKIEMNMNKGEQNLIGILKDNNDNHSTNLITHCSEILHKIYISCKKLCIWCKNYLYLIFKEIINLYGYKASKRLKVFMLMIQLNRSCIIY